MSCNKNRPSSVSPHPSVVAKLRAERGKAQQDLNGKLLDPRRFSKPTGTIPGLNDGRIYPPHHTATEAVATTPWRGQFKMVVILAEFSDVKMDPNAKSLVQNKLFSTGQSAGSVNDFYKEVSNNLVSFAGDIYGPFTLPHKQAYYANNDKGQSSSEPNSQTLAADAVDLAKSSVPFQNYDLNKDGYVDGLIIVHSGPSAENESKPELANGEIWPQKWNLTSEKTVNGVKIYSFLTVGVDSKLGTCCHETGHLMFGWPDLYDTDDSSQGVGSWCLMGAGSWGSGGDWPVHPSAWCKVTQGWVTVVNHSTNSFVAVGDVKLSHQVHKLYNNGDTTKTEYFLIENRQKTGNYEKSLPESGLLIWHIDDAASGNTNERHYKVALMQADGFNELVTFTAGRGDSGDPFPGRSGNTSFSLQSAPSSQLYTSEKSYIRVTDISPSSSSMFMTIGTVQPSFVSAYQSGTGHGIGGYDLLSPKDLVLGFDYNGIGKADHLVLYRPGTGICWILNQTFNQPWTALYSSSKGIGGYDLLSPADQIIAFDGKSTGVLDHLVAYRPGAGAIFILERQNTTWSAIYAQGEPGKGIANFDFGDENDRAFAFDYASSGKQDHLCCYRPGSGWMVIVQYKDGVYSSAQNFEWNIGGFDLSDTKDSAFAFDWDKSGKMDHIMFYRPVSGVFWCVQNNGGTFTAVLSIYANWGPSIGGYNLSDPADVAFAFDLNGTGKKDHVVIYRPGAGTFWLLEHSGGANFYPLIQEGNPPQVIGKGVGGYDLKSVQDKIVPFDFYDRTGKTNSLVAYRTDGSGIIWILKVQ